jgi:hypothetical protein
LTADGLTVWQIDSLTDRRIDGSLARWFNGRRLGGSTVNGVTALQLSGLTVQWLDGLMA